MKDRKAADAMVWTAYRRPHTAAGVHPADSLGPENRPGPTRSDALQTRRRQRVLPEARQVTDPARWLGHKRARKADPRDALKEVDRLSKEVEELKRELREFKEKEKGQWLGPPRIGY